MLIFLLLVLLSGVHCLTPEQCDLEQEAELIYTCSLNSSTVTFKSRKDEYVWIICDGTDYDCSDLPRFDFVSNIPLRSLGLDYCSPSILRCVNDVVNATSIQILNLKNLSGPLKEEDLENLGDVQMLRIEEAEAETSLPIAVLKAFPNLNELRIGGAKFQLTPHIFDHSPPLHYLELSKDHMISLPSDGFSGLKVLNKLNIWGNSIDQIDVGSFKGLESLEELTLSTNTLKYISPGALSDAANLVSLNLIANDLELLDNGVLQNLEHLENVTIQMNRADLKLGSQAFSHLPSLKNLVLIDCMIANLSDGLFNGTHSLQTLDMRNNVLESLPQRLFAQLVSLKHLDLSFNKIKELPGRIFAGLRRLEYLNMNRNHLDALPDDLFSGPTMLKQVYIEDNTIKTIARTSFQGVPNLEILSLKSNQLTLESQVHGYSNFEAYSPFSSLIRLKKLNLSGNLIRVFFYDWGIILLQLQYLDLSRNKFKEIVINQSEGQILSGVTIDLRYNSIANIVLQPHDNMTLTPTATMLLDDNPIVCDCYLYGLKMRVDYGKYLSNEPKLDLDNAKCVSPPNLEGRYVKNISQDDLYCAIDDLPTNCSSMSAKIATSELVLDCPEMPLDFPDIYSENITHYFTKQPPNVTLNLRHQPQIWNNAVVHTLNLSSSNIETIDFPPFESLKVLDVSHNKLTSVPMDFLEANITLYLADNPLECECWSAKYLDDLINYHYIKDLDKITCANGVPLSKTLVTGLCNTWKAAITGIMTFISLGIFVMLGSLIVYKYSHEILVYMTSRGICSCCVREVEHDSSKQYDVFVSFAHENLDFVQNELLPKLEEEFDQKVCVHYRDWVIGDLIPTQIIRSVESSRKTIIVLSKSFLESMWANMEFSTAHNLALQEGKSRVILILLDENLRKSSKLSEELRAYIALNTYLLCGDPKFWERLRKVLPRTEHTFTWLDALKQRTTSDAEKPMKSGLDVHLNSDGKLFNVAAKEISDDTNLPQHFV